MIAPGGAGERHLQPGRPRGCTPLRIVDGIRAAAERLPAKVALEEGPRRLDYRSLIDRIDRLTNAAGAGLGLTPGTHTAVLAPNCLEYVELLSGLAAAGAPAAQISPQATEREIARICDDSEARVLFVHASLEERARATQLDGVERIVVLGEDYERLLACARPVPPAPVAAEEWATFCIPYSSGTTGDPKGILLSDRARALTFFAMAVEYGAFGPHVRSLCVAPIAHGAGLVSAFAAVYFGGWCSIAPRFDPELLLAQIERERITAVNLVPTHYAAILELDPATVARHDTSSLRTLMSNAAALAQPAKEGIVERFGPHLLHESYGSTEAGFVTTLGPADQLRKPGSVGHPFPGARVRLLDEQGAEVEPGQVGELHSCSPYLFNGYWKRPRETARAFRGGWFSAGDLAHRDEEGYLYLAHRRTDLIVSGGLNVNPREVEDELLRHPAVAGAAVVGLPDDYWGQAVHAAVELRAGAGATAEELRAHCARRLAGYKRPKAVAIVDALPRNAMGKVLHREVRERMAGGRASS